jgi:tRNA dimethylallyltransferase
MRDGTMSEEEAKEDTKRASRQYARRQETWFSRDARITWVAQHQPRLETILQKINS